MLRLALIVGLFAYQPAWSQTAEQLARFSEAITAMEARSYTFYSSIDARFAELLAPTANQPDFRENPRCVLARIEKDGGSDMVEEYIEATELQGQREIKSLIELANRLPAVMTADLIFAASAECGPMSHTTNQMMKTPFIELMDDPKIMQRLMGN